MSDNGNNREGLDLVTIGFILSLVASLGLIAVYFTGGQNQLEGLLLFVALGGVGFSLVVLAHRKLGEAGTASEERGSLPSEQAVRDATGEDLSVSGLDTQSRRRFLTFAGAALGALGLAGVLPALSLGPQPQGSLFKTKWTKGAKLVAESGQVITVDDIEEGGIITVFPEGHTDAADSQTLLIRVASDKIVPVEGREDWSPEGFIAYSKVCTHAGCPVGLFDNFENLLFCPCHQSTFDVLNGAKRVFGPAPRPLPQLPLKIEDDGTITAQADYDEPIGPSFWNRLKEQ